MFQDSDMSTLVKIPENYTVANYSMNNTNYNQGFILKQVSTTFRTVKKIYNNFFKLLKV